MFEERKTKFTLLSLLSAVLVLSIAFTGISIYAQTTDDSDQTTFEEEEMSAGEESATDSGDNTSTAADVSSMLDGLQVCNVGTAEISDETEVAAVPDGTATVSVQLMARSEVADLASNETGTASDDETSTASADCVLMGSDDGNNNANSSTSDGSNGTAIASAPDSQEILVIDGQGFAPGQVVLMFTEDALVGIDDVDQNGNIEAKIPVPDSGNTAIASNDSGNIELRFLESGTQRTTTFEFDGETLTAQSGSDIEAESSEDNN